MNKQLKKVRKQVVYRKWIDELKRLGVGLDENEFLIIEPDWTGDKQFEEEELWWYPELS